jgi:hypothetical protein
MANPSDSTVQNLLPVQAYFDVQGNFQTFIGQGQPFYATANPQQSGLNITNSTINSTTIGATTPATGVFTNISTTTGTITTAPTGATDIANKQYVDFYAAGLSWKQPVRTATSANITRSGLQTINGVTVVAGDRVLVKDQSTASENGIYVASATAWTYAVGADDWNEYVGAIVFVVEGSLNGTAWYCTAQPGGTLGVTAMNWSNFSVASSYTAGTGLTLIGTQFSITNTGVSAATYGSASSVPVIAINAQGQATSVTNTNIAINGNQITSGTIGSSYLSGSYTGITGLGTLTDLTVTNAIVGSITGNAATATLATSATSATTATNLAGGASGNVPYQTASGTTTFLATGSNGQVLTLASGVPSWATPTTGTVTSVSGTGTVSGISLSGTVTSTGNLTLGGTLDLSSPPAIGGTSPNTGAFTTLTSTNDATIHGLIVGKGGGSVSNNTVLGVTALDSNTTGQQNVAIGINALTTATTANNQTAVGYQALRLSTASDNTAVGSTALQSNSTGGGNVAMGFQTLTANTTGGSNTAIGRHALITNSTGSNLTAIGNHAGAYETGSNALYIDAYDRTNTAGDKAGALLYGTFNSTPSSQTLTINGQVTLPYQLNLNATLALTGSAGSSGQVLTSAGAGSTPTWTTPTVGITITDDTTTNATRYLAFTSATSGSITGQNVASTKLQFNPSTGVLTATTFSGAGTSLTGTASSLTAGAVANALTAGTGLTATATYNGSAAITFNATGTTINSQTSGYTLVATDAGKTISITTGGVTIPNAVMSAGNIVTIYNNSGSSQTLTQGTSLTLQWAGQASSSTGNRTLGLYGIATIVFITSSNAVISGAGLT